MHARNEGPAAPAYKLIHRKVDMVVGRVVEAATSTEGCQCSKNKQALGESAYMSAGETRAIWWYVSTVKHLEETRA